MKDNMKFGDRVKMKKDVHYATRCENIYEGLYREVINKYIDEVAIITKIVDDGYYILFEDGTQCFAEKGSLDKVDKVYGMVDIGNNIINNTLYYNKSECKYDKYRDVVEFTLK